MTYDLIVRNALITTSQFEELGSVAVKDGRFVSVGAVEGTAEVEIDAQGLTLIPGVIDTQVHFREPGLEHKEDLESGTRAAILGGVTSIFEMPNTNPTTTSEATLQDKLNRAHGRAWCDYSFFVGAAKDNIDGLARLEAVPGSPGIKIFMGSSTGPLLVDDDEHLRSVLRSGRRRSPIHAEDEARNVARKALISENPHPREHPFLRDAESAKIATTRILRLSEETKRPIHVLHVSTADELPLLADAKRRGLGTTCEITPQHLWFHAPDCYDRLGTLAQMNPPLRSAEHQAGLRQAVRDGLFDVIGSDHAPHTLEEKAKPYPQSPSGMPGVQTLLSVMLTLSHRGLLSIKDFVRMACENPAVIYDVRGKGFLSPGYDADFVLLDPKREQTFERNMVASKCGWSPYEGERLTGWPVHVFLRGSQIVRDGALMGGQTGRPVEFTWK